jgi:DNA-binding response OmpR family regulator
MINIESILKYTRQLNILYVEDDIQFRNETNEIFEDYFSSITLADNGKDGLYKYEEYMQNNNKPYDIVITDVCMPHMDGITLVKEIYKQNKTQAIIVISAYNDASFLIELINLGIEQFLMKPFQMEQISEVFYKTSKKLIEQPDNNELININNNYKWCKETLRLFYNDEVCKLTKKETLFIELLTTNLNKIYTLDQIYYALWEDNYEQATHESFKAILSRLRKKVPKLELENIYGIGYRFK